MTKKPILIGFSRFPPRRALSFKIAVEGSFLRRINPDATNSHHTRLRGSGRPGRSGGFGFSIAATLIVQTITLAPLMLIAANVRNLVAGGCYVLCGHRPKVA